eukprot:NODE_4795_length_640_cov_335.429060.p1 GENE.NODE_4795_length_640_cov_335.429060~~NODE_4795_length_640_cov_335.429060.p1  ORF type:complete len:188 (-),score=54.84 NODE_4795_length_640_cov_335.429060:75-638(-)
MQDTELLRDMGADLLMELAAPERNGGAAWLAGHLGSDVVVDRAEGNDTIVLPRGVFETRIRVAAGQRLSWFFHLAAPSEPDNRGGILGGLLDLTCGEATDLDFAVGCLPEAECSATCNCGGSGGCGCDEQEEVLVPASRVDAALGDVRGTAELQRGGVAVLRWSNAHGAVRLKRIAYYLVVVSSASD